MYFCNIFCSYVSFFVKNFGFFIYVRTYFLDILEYVIGTVHMVFNRFYCCDVLVTCSNMRCPFGCIDASVLTDGRFSCCVIALIQYDEK